MSNQKYALIFYKDYAQTVTSDFQRFLEKDLYIDLIFVCRNNKKVGAHQVVLGCLSKLFYSIFADNMNSVKEKVIYIYVPDIRAKIMKYILQFIYSGKATLNEEELQEFNEDIKLLGMPLDHFTAPSEATENTEKPAAEKSMEKSVPRVPRIVRDTVDLTDTSINGDSSNSQESSIRESPAERNKPATVTTAPNTNTNDAPTPPLISQNATDKNPSAGSSEPENRTTSTSSSTSSNATIKVRKSSELESRTSSISSSSSPDVEKRKLLKGSGAENRRPSTSSTSSATTAAHQCTNHVVKNEIAVPKVPENDVKKIPNGDCKTKRSKDAAPPPKRGKYLISAIDLDSSDDDDVITLS